MLTTDEKTLESLEFIKIVESIRGCCLTPFGAEKTLAMRPTLAAPEMRLRLREASQMKDLLLFDDPFPLARIDDIRPLLAKASTEGARLETEDFLLLREFIGVTARLRAYKRDNRENFPELAVFLNRLPSYPELRDEINRVIGTGGEIKDNASPALRKCRSSIEQTRRRLISKLEEIVSRRPKTPGWQDDLVTRRGDRYVIPSPANTHRSADGLIVDQSQSGATYFVEPPFAVELNNLLVTLAQEERREIDRILRELTSLVRELLGPLRESVDLLGIIDKLHAIASFSIKIEAHAPLVSDKAEINLLEARHPLLLMVADDKTKIVPLNLNLDDNRRGLLITGPNTGGKTVALKTVGLLALMTRSGLLIPADPRSTVGVFDRVFADIGDEQSIELSLSTFSSHITKVIKAVENSGPADLLLFDEIGAGTDPGEGAALAEAIILRIIRSGARLIVTTHYSRLKTLPLEHPELENASLEFDEESLQPTYIVRIGSPGSSYAIEIAERLGMPREITEQAAKILGAPERSLAELISGMETELRQVRLDSAKLAEKLSEAENSEANYSALLKELKQNADEHRRNALKESEDLVSRTRGEMEALVKRIRESQASREEIKKGQRILASYGQGTESTTSSQAEETTRESSQEKGDTANLRPGDTVWSSALKVDGEVVEICRDGQVRVRFGNMLNLVERDDLIKADVKLGRRPRRDPVGLREETAPAPEIHLRGMTVEEATERLDKFLDSAVLSGLSQVYVIHGKGAGILRRALTDFLKNHMAVDSVRMGDWNQGGAGVTVVKLK